MRKVKDIATSLFRSGGLWLIDKQSVEGVCPQDSGPFGPFLPGELYRDHPPLYAHPLLAL